MNKRSRFLLVLAVIVLCCVFLWPSVAWYMGTPKEVQALALSSLEKIKDYMHVLYKKVDVKNPFSEDTSRYLMPGKCDMEVVASGAALYFVKDFLDEI